MPARAANALWCTRFLQYEADVAQELGAARRALRLPSLRVALHSLATRWPSRRAAGAAKHAECVEALFGDGWNHGPGRHARATLASCAADGSE